MQDHWECYSNRSKLIEFAQDLNSNYLTSALVNYSPKKAGKKVWDIHV